ncbi:MAG: hypothetical protein WBO04_07140 [Steroidobacteraceae bacterium]
MRRAKPAWRRAAARREVWRTLGVLRAIREAGIQVDMIAGTGMGADLVIAVDLNHDIVTDCVVHGMPGRPAVAFSVRQWHAPCHATTTGRTQSLPRKRPEGHRDGSSRPEHIRHGCRVHHLRPFFNSLLARRARARRAAAALTARR